MKEIYIIMSHSGSIISKIIKVYTRANYSHVSIGFDISLKEFYSFGRKKPTTPIGGGFVIEGINHGVFKRFKNAKCRIYRLTLSDDKYELLKQHVNKFIANSNNYKYNYLGIFTIMFGFKFNRKNSYFCSQFVAKLLHESQIYKFHKDVSLVRPKDFDSISEAKLIYEGRLADYEMQKVL